MDIKSVLITNDDGIETSGIRALTKVAEQLFPEAMITVFAPAEGINGAGRSLTLGGGKLVRVIEAGLDRFAVHGTPCDCVDIACRTMDKFDLCLSGVNHGFNLGDDLPLSGTAQAAHYARDYFGVTSIAFSADKWFWEKIPVDRSQDLNKPVRLAISYIKDALGGFRNTRGFFNVNIPAAHEMGVRSTKLGVYRAMGRLSPKPPNDDDGSPHHKGTLYDLRDAMSEMETSEGDLSTDVGAIRAGFISITRVV